jgi:hypothetical protein
LEPFEGREGSAPLGRGHGGLCFWHGLANSGSGRGHWGAKPHYDRERVHRSCRPDFCANAARDNGSPTSVDLNLQDTRIVQESSISISEGAEAKAGEQVGIAHGESAAVPSEHLRGLPAAGISPESLVSRLMAMFLGEGEAPRASRLGELASEGLLLLIVAVDVACTRFWKAHIDAVKRACAPALIAKQEVFGYLLNDCIRGTLLYPDDALSVGQRGDNAMAKAKAVLKVKAKRDVAEACWRAAVANPAALTSQPPYDLKLPAVTVGVKRSAHQWAERDCKAAEAGVKNTAVRLAAADAADARAELVVERKLVLLTAAAEKVAVKGITPQFERAKEHFAAAVSLKDEMDADRVEACATMEQAQDRRLEAFVSRSELALSHVALAEEELMDLPPTPPDSPLLDTLPSSPALTVDEVRASGWNVRALLKRQRGEDLTFTEILQVVLYDTHHTLLYRTVAHRTTPYHTISHRCRSVPHTAPNAIL